MTARSLTPTLALAYLRELSVDVRAAVVLDATGEPLAGDAELAGRAREALRGGEIEGAWTIPADGGALVVARASNGLAIAVTAGDRALLPLLEHDVKSALSGLCDV